MTTGSVNNPIALLLAEVMRCGLHFAIAGDKIRVGPRDRMPPGLAGRIKDHKQELKALWQTVEVRNRPAVHYTDAECAVLAQAGIEPGDLPILETAKSLFPDSTVVSAEYNRQPPGKLPTTSIKHAATARNDGLRTEPD